MSSEQNQARQVIVELMDSGLTIREVAKAVGINKSVLAEFARGHGNDLTPQEIRKLEHVLGSR